MNLREKRREIRGNKGMGKIMQLYANFKNTKVIKQK